MPSRRRFIKQLAIGSTVLSASSLLANPSDNNIAPYKDGLVLTTWPFGLKANEAAWKIIGAGGRALDAVEQGVMTAENDPNSTSVGLAAYPDRDGIVSLDACIMDEKGNAGSVCAIQQIKNPISVARRVMEKTPHVILAGEGALQFAKEEGFPIEKKKLSPHAEVAWKEWLKKAEYKPVINSEMHDTIGMVAIDKSGNLSGACTTSGVGFKLHGRVGDSPIIGAGLFVDNEVGAATSTGLGEYVLKTLGSFLIVELMKQGYSPQKACEEAAQRIIKKYNYKDFQVCYLAINKFGETGAYSIHSGFEYALYKAGDNKIYKSSYYIS